MAKRFVIPFATSGDKSVTPDATDPAGAISYSQGWPVAYQLADTDPNYRPVGRQEMNGVLFDVTGAIAEIQAFGFPEWVPVAGLVTPYAVNAVLRHNGNNWRNTVPNNSVEPGTDSTWVLNNELPGTLTTAGVAPNFTLTPSPAIPAYAVGQNFSVRFSATPAGVPTINVSGRGAVALKQYNSAGVKVQAVVALDQISRIEHDGTDFVVLNQLPPSTVIPNLVGVTGLAKNLKASATGLSAAIVVTCDEVIVKSAGNAFKTLYGISVTPSFANPTGANGLDVGAANSQTASTWYYLHVIWNETTDARAGLLSLSATAPTLPAGFTHSALVLETKTDATVNKFPLGFTKNGTLTQYKVTTGTNLPTSPRMAFGVAGANPSAATPTWAAVPWAAFFPPNAKSMRMTLASFDSGSIAAMAPNNSFGGFSSPNNPPASTVVSVVGSGPCYTPTTLLPESANFYWVSNGAGNGIYALGWES